MSQQGNESAKHQVENDLSSFLKRVRQREEQHHKLCDYTNRLLARQSELQQTIYIHDEITRLQAFHQQALAVDLVHQETDFSLAHRCQTILTADQQNVLGRRVISRVLEVTYAAIDAFREFGQYYSKGYLRFKEKCLKTASQAASKTSVAIRLTSRYLTQKIQIQLQRLKQAICCLEANNYEYFIHLMSTYYDLIQKKESKVEEHKVQTSTLILSRKNNSRQELQVQLNVEKETKRQIRVRSKAKTTREERQKTRRIRLKKLKKLTAQILEVMDVQKQDLLDDLGPENKQWVTKRILGFLVQRNKTNRAQINSFLVKQPQYLEALHKLPPAHFEKIKRCQSLEEELLEKSLEFCKEEEINKNTFTVKDIRISETSLPKKTNSKPRSERRESMRSVPLSGNKGSQKRQRFTINNIEEVDLKKKEVFISQKNLPQHESVVQIQFKAQVRLPKARFPEITARAASVSKVKLTKQEESPIRTKLEIKPSSSYFEEIEKRIVKFCQMKRNLVI